MFELFLLKENLPDFFSVWISLNKPTSCHKVKPLSLIIPRLKSTIGIENKNLPPKANNKANNIEIIKIIKRTVFEIFFAEVLAISRSRI